MSADMTDRRPVDRWEQELRAQAHSLVDPQENECLICFVSRAVDEVGCDSTLRWAARFRDLRVPAATGLEERLGELGGLCDCEVPLNGFMLAREHLVRDVHTDELSTPARLPTCAGVGRTSARPCTNWVRGVGLVSQLDIMYLIGGISVRGEPRSGPAPAPLVRLRHCRPRSCASRLPRHSRRRRRCLRRGDHLGVGVGSGALVGRCESSGALAAHLAGDVTVDDVGVTLGLALRPHLGHLVRQALLEGLATVRVTQVVGLALRRRVALVEHVLDAPVLEGVLRLQLVFAHALDGNPRRKVPARGFDRSRVAHSP